MFIPIDTVYTVLRPFIIFLFFISYQDVYYSVSLEKGYVVLRGREKDNILEPIKSVDKPSLSLVRKNDANFFSKKLYILMAMKINFFFCISGNRCEIILYCRERV